MKLSARQDIDAPQEDVFGALQQFDHWERAAMRRGADVLRTDTLVEPAPGMTWQIGFVWRGRARKVTARLAALNPPQAMHFTGASPAAEGTVTLDVVALGARRTRLSVKVEVRPRTLAARLFVQSMRLMRARAEARFAAAFATFAGNLAQHAARQAQPASGRPAPPR